MRRVASQALIKPLTIYFGQVPSSTMIKIAFATSNVNKVREIQELFKQKLPNVLVTPTGNLRLTEIQADSSEAITQAKLLSAKKALKKSDNGFVMVEDTSLCINALGGLPGPYIKYFEDKIGPEGIFRILADYEDRSAIAKCHIGLASLGNNDKPMNMKIFSGHCQGQIVVPKGTQGFGWDRCFQPDGNLHFMTNHFGP